MSVGSDTEMCNLALSAIGHGENILVDLKKDQGKPADACREHYVSSRRAALRSYTYNFSIKRAWLSNKNVTPAFEFAYTFSLPTDPYCLKVIRSDLEARHCPDNYRVEGRNIVTNRDTFGIEYAADIVDVREWDALFVEAFKYRLASALAIPVADSKSLAKEMMSMHQRTMDDSFVTDSQEGTPREIVDLNPWLTARL